MQLQLLHGQFSQHDAINIVSQMVDVKIKYHEGKINNESSEEEIKMRETRIKQLQNDLLEARKNIEAGDQNISIEAQMIIAK